MAVVVNWFERIILQLCIPFIHMGLGWGNHNILLDIWKQTNEYRSCIQRTPQLLRVQTDSYTEACVGQKCVLWKWLCSEEGGTDGLQNQVLEGNFRKGWWRGILSPTFLIIGGCDNRCGYCQSTKHRKSLMRDWQRCHPQGLNQTCCTHAESVELVQVFVKTLRWN